MNRGPTVRSLEDFVRVVASHEIETEYRDLKARLAQAERVVEAVRQQVPSVEMPEHLRRALHAYDAAKDGEG